MTEAEVETDGEGEMELEDVAGQLGSYERQLRRHLRNIDARVDSYHFTIQKEGDGITIDLALRTTLRPKHKAAE